MVSARPDAPRQRSTAGTLREGCAFSTPLRKMCRSSAIAALVCPAPSHFWRDRHDSHRSADGTPQWINELMDTLGAPGAGLAVALENLRPPLPSQGECAPR
ncbi:hypothetical protein GCM10010254_12830 [Streptomyces chromofuscus]|nr:hypothetical protein GCM10010254_12830 [Streptomyces chromofuscus]